MKKVTVIKENGTVIVDGSTYQVNVSELPSYFRVIQWDDELKSGHIEFGNDAEGRHLPNLPLNDFTPYNFLIDRWNMKRVEEEVQQELAKRKQAAAAVQADKDQEARLREVAEKGV